VLVVPVSSVGMMATRNDPPQISRTASAAEALGFECARNLFALGADFVDD
jgi:hypothetical protein